MTDRKRDFDAEEEQRRSETIDTASGPGPVLDQNDAAPMPLFDENDRSSGTVNSVIDPAEFASMGNPSGEELDSIEPIGEPDDLGVAGRAAQDRPELDEVS